MRWSSTSSLLSVPFLPTQTPQQEFGGQDRALSWAPGTAPREPTITWRAQGRARRSGCGCTPRPGQQSLPNLSHMRPLFCVLEFLGLLQDLADIRDRVILPETKMRRTQVSLLRYYSGSMLGPGPGDKNLTSPSPNSAQILPAGPGWNTDQHEPKEGLTIIRPILQIKSLNYIQS